MWPGGEAARPRGGSSHVVADGQALGVVAEPGKGPLFIDFPFSERFGWPKDPQRQGAPRAQGGQDLVPSEKPLAAPEAPARGPKRRPPSGRRS